MRLDSMAAPERGSAPRLASTSTLLAAWLVVAAVGCGQDSRSHGAPSEGVGASGSIAPVEANHDGCLSSGQACVCSDTGKNGSCSTGSMKSGLYCRCDLAPAETNHDGCLSSGQACVCSNTGANGSCNTGSLKSGLYCQCDQAPPAPAPVAPPAPKPAAAAQPACSGEETPCQLRGGRVGWCKSGRCKDICPPGKSYSHLDADCHRPCGPGCGNCMEGLCFE